MLSRVVSEAFLPKFNSNVVFGRFCLILYLSFFAVEFFCFVLFVWGFCFFLNLMSLYGENHRLPVVNKMWGDICIRSKHLVKPWAVRMKYGVCLQHCLESHPIMKLSLELRSACELGIKQRMQML